MPRDAPATRAAILAAAIEEFSALGLAGARVDRIAERSGSNKRMIYVHYGDKEGLFAASLDHVVGAMIASVPVTEDDLPGYAGALFDHVVERPEALRLSMWRQLERPASGPRTRELYAEKVAAMTSGERDALAATAGIGPIDLLVLVQGMAGAWMISPRDLLAADGSEPSSSARLAVHRAALVEAVRRIVDPAP